MIEIGDSRLKEMGKRKGRIKEELEIGKGDVGKEMERIIERKRIIKDERKRKGNGNDMIWKGEECELERIEDIKRKKNGVRDINEKVEEIDKIVKIKEGESMRKIKIEGNVIEIKRMKDEVRKKKEVVGKNERKVGIENNENEDIEKILMVEIVEKSLGRKIEIVNGGSGVWNKMDGKDK